MTKKLIGIYASADDAKAAIQRIKDKPGSEIIPTALKSLSTKLDEITGQKDLLPGKRLKAIQNEWK